jgi:tetratricopeptide (TPR) repeat protein
VPEVSYPTALADEGRLDELSEDWLSIGIPGNYRETPKELAQMAGEKLTKPSELNRRGYKMLEAWKFDEAITDFTAALQIEPNDPVALASRGIAYVWKKEYDKARHDLDEAEKLDPKEPVIFRAKGLMAQQLGNWKEAVEAYTAALLLDPKSTFSFGHRAEAYRASGDDKLALADSETALKLEPNSASMRLLRANIYLAQGKPDLAAKEADELRKTNPGSSYDLVAAGNIYAKASHQRESQEAYQQALAIKPEAFIYLNRGMNRPLSDRAGRDADIDLALKLEPSNADALMAKAEELRNAGELKGALSYYERAIKAGLTDPFVRTQAAVVAFRLGREEEAKANLGQIRKEATAAQQFNNLCWAKATAGILLESALDDCREALKLSPDNGAYLDSLGMVLLRLGRDDEAIAAYDGAIGKNIGAVSLLGRAIAHARRGEAAKAAADRAEALRKDPDIEARFKTFGLSLPS